MSWINNSNNIKVGDKVILTKQIGLSCGYFKKGSIVTIIGIGERGYDISDDKGHKITECGWSICKKIDT